MSRRLIVSALIALTVGLWFLIFGERDYIPQSRRIDGIIAGLLADSGIMESDLTYRRDERNRFGRDLFLSMERRYAVGQDFDAVKFEDGVKRGLSKTPFVITGVISTLKRGVKGDGLTLSFRGRTIYTILFMRSKGARRSGPSARYREENAAGGVEPGQARVAIVLDDFGYNMRNTEYLFETGEPVTLSILPGLPYSGKAALAARENGYEAILHLPLEPYDGGGRLEEGTIMSDMDKDEILSLLAAAIDGVPYVKGVSNHMGSKATEDVRVMGVIFREMKRKGLFFLDSLSTSGSVCGGAAREAGIGYARRDVFLDNEKDPEYIKGQLQRLADRAVETGSAIGVGHDRVGTVEAIRGMVQEMKGRGIRFVFLSELVK